MRKNEYNSLNEFIYEYDSGRAGSTEKQGRKYMGIEFVYHGTYYRICREPLPDNERPVLPNGKLGVYNVTIMHCVSQGYPVADRFESIGWYSDIYDLLKNCYIGGVPFEAVIMDDDTEILSKD